MSKELENIRKAIGEYIDKYKGKVQITGSFMAFKGKDFEIVDDMLFCYGVKESVLIDLEELTKAVKKEKEEFIDW